MRHRPGTLGSASTSWPATTASSAAAWACSSAELRAVERVEHPLGVGDQIIYEPRPLVGVVPVTHRPGPSCRSHGPAPTAAACRRQAAHTPNLRADHRDGVLGRDRVDTAPWSPAPASSSVRQRPALSGHLAHRVEDPLRAPAGAQPLAPQRQHARIEAPVVDAQPRRGLPAHIAAQPLQRLAVRTPLQRLQNHHHRDHRPRHRRPPPTARRDPRTTRQETTSGGSRPRTDAPTPPAPEPPHKPKVSNSSRSSFSVPCMPPMIPHPHTRSRAPRPELLSSLLGAPW